MRLLEGSVIMAHIWQATVPLLGPIITCATIVHRPGGTTTGAITTRGRRGHTNGCRCHHVAAKQRLFLQFQLDPQLLHLVALEETENIINLYNHKKISKKIKIY